MTPRRVAWVTGLLMTMPTMANAQVPGETLKTLSLEQLMTLPVTTMTRQPQARLQAPASLFVLTEGDIRRSGATTLAEVLRLVPGVHVAQIDGNKWAIGIRGFTDRLARAMLVMIDNRPVYSPLFAGTYWEVQDLPLGDIERIEVIRGPGGVLWGANAVTGVVHIIRKSAAATAGGTATLGGGSEDPAFLDLRYGGASGDRFHYRLSTKMAARSPQEPPSGLEYDSATLLQAGARGDWETDRGAVTLQGDIYRSVIGQRDSLTTYEPPSNQFQTTKDPLTGGNVMLRWDTDPSDPRSLQVQVYYDHTSRSELVFRERQHVVNFDYQQGAGRGRHGLLWGAEYRLVAGSTETEGTLKFDPADRVDHLVTGFVQDEFRFARDRLTVSAGTKFERNGYSGVEWQPGARLLWAPSPTHALSMSVIRARRTPSRVEHDFQSGSLLTPSGPMFVRLQPNKDFAPEEVTAYEASVVSMLRPSILVTAALFRNQHEHVLSAELGQTFVESDALGTRTIVPVKFGNGLRGRSVGVEVTGDIRVTHWWRSTLNYSALRFQLSRIAGSADVTQEARAEQGSPRHQVQLTAAIDLPGRTSIDWFLRYVSALPAVGVGAYATSNLRFEMAVGNGTSIFVTGRNLHRTRHAEFSDGSNGVIQIQRAAVVGLRWTR